MSSINKALTAFKKDYFILYIAGGGLYGIGQTQAIEFLEDLTGLKTTDTFNKVSGDSNGAILASGLTTPKDKKSLMPLSRPQDIRYFYFKEAPKIFPFKLGFYARQFFLDLLKLGIDGIDAGLLFLAKKQDYILNQIANFLKRKRLQVLNGIKKNGQTPEYFDRYNIRFSEISYRLTLGRVVGFCDQVIEKLLECGLYDIEILRDILNKHFRHSNGSEPKLSDSLTSLFISALNLNTGEPAHFHHHRHPRTGESQFVSDDVSISEIICRSAAAPTVFPSYKGYVDIAPFKTPLDAMLAAKRQLGWRYNIKLVVINTNRDDKTFDPRAMKNLLFLRQIMQGLNGILLGAPQMMIKSSEWRRIREEFGDHNITIIDRSEDEIRTRKRYSKSGIAGAIQYWGLERVKESKRIEIEDLPRAPFFDSRPRTLKKLNRFGFATVWENATTLIELAKDLIDNAASHGKIPTETALERKNFIDSLFAPERSPLQEVAKISVNQAALQRRDELHKKWPFLKSLRQLFNDPAALNPDGTLKTTFTPLEYGDFIPREDSIIDGRDPLPAAASDDYLKPPSAPHRLVQRTPSGSSGTPPVEPQ